MKTVSIKGKPYVMVHERIKHFRESDQYKGWSLRSEIIEYKEGVVLIGAFIKDTEGNTIATGFAQEKEKDGFINKSSYIENCETSAWGRALANLGIGIGEGVDSGVASAEEVENARMNQGKPELDRNHIKWNDAIDALRNGDTTIPEIKEHFEISPGNQSMLINEAAIDPIAEGKNYNQTDIKEKIKE